MNSFPIAKEQAPQFTDEELADLNEHMAKDGSVLSVSVAANFMALYLEGKTLKQICQQFKQWPKGAILHAAYAHNWEEQKQNYIQDLMLQLRDRLAKSKLEVVNHIMDVLAVAHKEFSHEMSIYLQNPKPENLPRNRIKSHKEYKEVLSTLQQALILGQPTKEGGAGNILVNVNAADGSTVQITSGEHSDALKQLVKGKDE